MHTQADISTSEEFLGYSPDWELEEGIKDYWKEKNEVSIDGIPTQIQEGY